MDEDGAASEEAPAVSKKAKPVAVVAKNLSTQKSDVPDWAKTVNFDGQYRMGAYNNVRSPGCWIS